MTCQTYRCAGISCPICIAFIDIDHLVDHCRCHKPDATASNPVTACVCMMQAMIRDSQGLESKLMKLNQEKAELEAEYARMPSHAGRNLKERKRKTDIECRFEVLDQDVKSIRLQLKKLGLK